MPTRKLTSVEGFIVEDLPGAECSAGPVRLGAKLIASNAINYAREVSYAMASLEQRRGGMTIGLKVDPDGREEAVAAVCEELAEELAAGRFAVDPGLRMARAQLGGLVAGDPRNALAIENGDELRAVGAAAIANKLIGLDGRTVAIEGVANGGGALAAEVERLGGSVGRISTAKGCVSGSFSAADIAAAVAAHGVEAPSSFGEVDKPWSVWRSSGVDLIFCGSGAGALTAAGAPAIGTTPVVGTTVACVATKALAILKAAGAPVTPGFLAALGEHDVAFDPAIDSLDVARSRTQAVVSGVFGEVADHADGPFVGACLRAEAFMASWAEEVPFGRPMA